ncbi:MAG: hypothetical protein AAFW82_02385 [Pseudomonadota bacterium]
MSIMRGFFLVGALLFAGKFGMHEYIRQDAIHQVVVDAYREHAMTSCRSQAGATINPVVWTQPSNVRLAIGKSDLNVQLWQTGHHLWNARYRNAYIYVSVDEPDSQVYCEYDIANDKAWVYQLGSKPQKNQVYLDHRESQQKM